MIPEAIMFRIGQKLLSKYPIMKYIYRPDGSASADFICGENTFVVIIDIIKDIHNDICIVVQTPIGITTQIRESDVEFSFYTIQEIRKMKINQIQQC